VRRDQEGWLTQGVSPLRKQWEHGGQEATVVPRVHGNGCGGNCCRGGCHVLQGQLPVDEATRCALLIACWWWLWWSHW